MVNTRMNIEYLADHPECIPKLATWLYEQWSWFLPPGNSAETVAAKFHAHTNRHTLPLALVALEGAELLGTASLRVHDMDILTDLTPWVGGVYVARDHRQKGIGGSLVRAIEHKAVELGFRAAYLFTFDNEPLYSSWGWEILIKLDYHQHPVIVMHKALS